jgi:radical SAM superfamily enzyme YgiQ (UPF0313 family)
MTVMVNFIFGDPAETKETAWTTIEFWKAKCQGQVRLRFVRPYPGSALYNYGRRKGLIGDDAEFIKTYRPSTGHHTSMGLKPDGSDDG